MRKLQSGVVIPARIRAIVASSLVLLLMCCGLQSVQAARIERPYLVDVPVATQSMDERTRAIGEGLQILLLRLSGQPQQDNPVVQQKIAAGADKLVLQFSYEKGQAPGGLLPQSGFLLRLNFSQNAVLQLMHEADIQTWPQDRPLTLVAMQDAQGHWMPDPANPESAGQLRQLGMQYGLPLALYRQDAADQADGVTLAALQAGTLSAIQSVTGRYQSDAVLTGTITGDDTTGWQGNWVLHDRGDSVPLAQQGPTLAAMLDSLMKSVAGRLSGRFHSSVVQDSGATTVQLLVTGIDNYASYTQLRSGLEKLDVVRRLSILRVDGTQVLIELDVTGKETLRSLLALSRQLVIEPPPSGSAPAATNAVEQAAGTPPAGVSPSPAQPATGTPASPAAGQPAAVSAPTIEQWHYHWTP